MKEWTTPDSRNTPSNINLEEEEIVDALRNDGNASMSEQVKRPNPWKKKKKKKKKMMMMMMMMMTWTVKRTHKRCHGGLYSPSYIQLEPNVSEALFASVFR